MQVHTDPWETLTDNDLRTVEEVATKCLVGGAALADIRGYTEDEMEAVYNFAHNAYQQRKYDEARQLFQFLAENDHTESRFWMGLAASHQMSGTHQQALTAYAMAALLDGTNPRPALHACECYLALADWANGRKALDAVYFLCGTADASTHGDVRKRAAVLSAIIAKANSEFSDKDADSPDTEAPRYES